jgi:ectoine hydroxylase-related dioxygenase (phytanoyl-CoA dioxygenase family)
MTHLHASTVTADDVVEALDRDGYSIVEGMLSPQEVASAKFSLKQVLDELPFGRNDFEGFSTRRVYALFAKTRAFDQAAINPLLLGVLDRVLGHYQLSAPTGIQIGPGEKAQALHYDASVYPLPREFDDVVVNTMWALDDFTVANGATRIVPGSHRWVDRRPAESDEIVDAVMPAGSVIFYGGKVFHGGGENQTDTPRLGVILEYVSAWLRPQETHLLAVPRATAANLPERLQELLQHLPAVPGLRRWSPSPPVHRGRGRVARYRSASRWRTRSASERMTWMAKVGVSCTRKRNSRSSIMASVVGALATAVAARGDLSIRAISPNTWPSEAVSTVLSPMRRSTLPVTTPYM